METQTKVPALEVVTSAPKGVDPVLQRLALTRFDATFKLEGEVIGKDKVRVKVSKKGAVTLSLKSMSSKDGTGLDVATGLKGDSLIAMRQQLAGQLKTEFGVMATRLTADKQYEAGNAVIKPNGAVTLEWKPVTEEILAVVSPKAAMASLGITEDEMAAIELAREQKAIEAKTKADKQAMEDAALLAKAKAELAANAAQNGEVTKEATADADDSKSLTA